MMTTTMLLVALTVTGAKDKDVETKTTPLARAQAELKARAEARAKAQMETGTIAEPSESRRRELAATAARRRMVRARVRQHNAVADAQTAAMVDGIIAAGTARGMAESARMAGAQAGRTGTSTTHQWQVREQYVPGRISSDGMRYIPGFTRLVPR